MHLKWMMDLCGSPSQSWVPWDWDTGEAAFKEGTSRKSGLGQNLLATLRFSLKTLETVAATRQEGPERGASGLKTTCTCLITAQRGSRATCLPAPVAREQTAVFLPSEVTIA